jgi:hypothetical protein
MIMANSIRMEGPSSPPTPGLPDAEVETIPENIPERKKTEKRVIVDENEVEQSSSSATPVKKKKKKLTGNL